MEIGPPKNRSNRRIKIHKRENDLKRFQNGTFLAEMRKITKFTLRARFLQKWLVFARNMLKCLRQIFDETIFSTEGDLDISYREFPDPQRGYYAFMFHTDWASGLLQEKFRKKLMWVFMFMPYLSADTAVTVLSWNTNAAIHMESLLINSQQ